MAKTRSSLNVETIDALSELESLGWKYEPSGENEVLCKCPVHSDKSPSLGVNTEKNVFRCRTAECGVSGDIVSLICHIRSNKGERVERSKVVSELAKKYPALLPVKTLNPATIEAYHENIWEAGPLLQRLYERGITDDLIRRARLGYKNGRIVIPIYDEVGRIINARHYLPGAPGKQKFRNSSGYGGLSLYLPEQLKFDTVWICGGEMKALAGSALLNEVGIGAVSVTGGEGTWDHSFSERFKGKDVCICMDIDGGGRVASKLIARAIFTSAKSVRIIRLPLDPDKFPKGDLNDYIGLGVTPSDLADLMSCDPFEPEEYAEEEDRESKEVRLVDAPNADNMGTPLVFEAMVAALHETPFIIPKVVKAQCGRDQPNCPWCPVKTMDPDEEGFTELTIKGSSPAILDMVSSPRKALTKGISEALRIPSCKTVEFTVSEHWNAMDVRLTPQLSVGGNNQEHVVQPAIVVDSRVELNVPYKMEGRVFPHPRNQEAVLVVNKVSEAEDSLTSFAPEDEDLTKLEVLRADSVPAKLDEIYNDIETNVTRIYQRRDLHLAIDLVYHSPLYFYFDGRLQNGWMNLLVVGDSAQGKSETSLRMMGHYGVGERVECKNSTPAGLIGGVQQLGTRWFVTWGVIPTHDRRMLFLEEIKGTETSTIGKLTDMRSSGVAEISKIEKRRAHARTRLVMVSNPRSERPMSAYNFGIEAIRELVGGLEDIRRFDLAVITAASQVDAAAINALSKNRPEVDHFMTEDVCRMSALWAWTRTADQIEFEEGAEDKIVEVAAALCETYSEAMPLVDRGTMRLKVARMSIALAARLFSTPKDPQRVLVRPSHVTYIDGFIRRLYSDPAFGYEDFSEAQRYASTVLDPEIIRRHIGATKFPNDLVEHLLHRDEITLIDIGDWCEMDREMSQKLLSFLVRKHALYREKRWYVKTPEFIALLKECKGKFTQNPETGKDEY